MNAAARYATQNENNATMQEPILTSSGLYVWEQLTFKNNTISEIRYYAEDENGGNTMRISQNDFIKLIS